MSTKTQKLHSFDKNRKQTVKTLCGRFIHPHRVFLITLFTLYRISLISRISHSRIYLCLLCFSVFEEFFCNLGEQCIR